MIGDRSVAESLALWGIFALFLLSLVMAAVASIAGRPDGGGPGNSLQQPTATPSGSASASGTPGPAGSQVSVPGDLFQDAEVSASEALAPVFGDSSPHIALLVSSASSLTEREAGWLDDIAFKLGPVEPVSYSEADFETLSEYWTVFVIDYSAEVDTADLGRLPGLGITVHLAGNAAQYADSMDLGEGAG